VAPFQAFWSRVDLAGGDLRCWLWRGARDKDGRGVVTTASGREVPAHKYVLFLAGKKVPQGHEVHHKCRNPLCVNPLHLDVLEVGEHRRRHIKMMPKDLPGV
jgi:hypothetical protein